MIIILTYRIKGKSVGGYVNCNYKINSRNDDNYKYGNTLKAMTSVFLQTKWKEFTFMPMIGTHIEHAAFDQSEIEHDDTGATILFANLGLRIFCKQLILFGEFQQSVYQLLNGYTQLLTKNKTNVGIAYIL